MKGTIEDLEGTLTLLPCNSDIIRTRISHKYQNMRERLVNF